MWLYVNYGHSLVFTFARCLPFLSLFLSFSLCFVHIFTFTGMLFTGGVWSSLRCSEISVFFLSDLNVTKWCSFARNRCYWVTKYKSPQPISFSFIQIHMNLTTHHILLSRMCSMISVFFGNHEFVLLLSFGIFVVEERSWVWHFWPTAELGHFIQKLDLGFSTRSHFRHRFFVQ